MLSLHSMKPLVRFMATASASQPIKTPLYDLHVKHGGKIIDFAGYSLPVTYDGLGVMKEHHLVRKHAAIFDVSHMGQIIWTGADRVAFLEKLVVGDIASLEYGKACLSLITNENGGIIDDTVITNAGDHIYQVVNGATKHGDLKHFKHHMESFKGEVHMTYQADHALVALQGPHAAEHLVKLGIFDRAQLDSFDFMTSKTTIIAGKHCRITRCGYTGEDGFEIGMRASDAVAVVESLLDKVADPEKVDNDAVVFAGLGCRDSLRLEAGLCLYGHDLNETITPVEASLLWTIPKRRREEADFLGASRILAQIADKNLVEKKRVGFKFTGPPAREGAKVFKGGKEVGVITSGSFSPSLNAPIGMGYVQRDLMKAGTAVEVEVRGKLRPATVSKLPFVEQRYFRAKSE